MYHHVDLKIYDSICISNWPQWDKSGIQKRKHHLQWDESEVSSPWIRTTTLFLLLLLFLLLFILFLLLFLLLLSSSLLLLMLLLMMMLLLLFLLLFFLLLPVSAKPPNTFYGLFRSHHSVQASRYLLKFCLAFFVDSAPVSSKHGKPIEPGCQNALISLIGTVSGRSILYHFIGLSTMICLLSSIVR